MSKNLEKVIQRAISDAAFRRQLQSNPEAALRGLKLTQVEVAALRSGDAGKLTSLGIDQRMSKVFTFGADGAVSRASIDGDLSSTGAALHPENTGGARMVIPGPETGSTPAVDPGMVGDPMSASRSNVIHDPDNPAYSRNTFDPGTSGSTASIVHDPENPAYSRNTLDQAVAPTSDALEDQSHAFAAGRSADVAGSGLAAPIEGTPEEFAFRDQAAGSAAIIRDPDNPAYARNTFDPGTSTPTASIVHDPENPAYSRNTLDQGAAPTSDALEDQSHAFAAGRSAADDAFLSTGEASQYSVDPNLSSDQAEDISHAFDPADTATLPDDTDTAAGNRGPDVPV
jgi:hypothetical protein